MRAKTREKKKIALLLLALGFSVVKVRSSLSVIYPGAQNIFLVKLKFRIFSNIYFISTNKIIIRRR